MNVFRGMQVTAEGLSGCDVGGRSDLGAVKADTAPLLRVAEQVDGEADLAELTASSASAAETGAALGARQTEALEAASQELLCSPEIVRCVCGNAVEQPLLLLRQQGWELIGPCM